MNAIARFATDYTVAAEIEALAWKLMDGEIEQGSDAMHLASMFADAATNEYETEAGVTFGATAQNIVRIVSQSLRVRIEQEIRRCDWEFGLEYSKRQRQGRIDANGCGDVPVWGG